MLNFLMVFSLQVSGYSDVGRSFNATAGFRRKDRAPGVGSWRSLEIPGGWKTVNKWMASMVEGLMVDDDGLVVDGNGRLVTASG